jgi:hypothetical protein
MADIYLLSDISLKCSDFSTFNESHWAIVKKEKNSRMHYIFKNVYPNFTYLLNEAAVKGRESNY